VVSERNHYKIKKKSVGEVIICVQSSKRFITHHIFLFKSTTHHRRWGAPGPLQCGPKSLYPQTGYWDFNHVCDDIWAVPPMTCDDYEGQQGGGAINDAPYPNGGESYYRISMRKLNLN
jgi:hypothetical protein